jgi:catechol 2,3-dioxygenase-like lactoylglutathione lyase family enzyme
MVYINLSVKDIGEAVAFYKDKLGIFSLQGDTRLICSINVDLIIDLTLCGTERHKERFGQGSHVVSSFWISPSDALDETKILIFENLRRHEIEYEEEANLGGHFLYFRDPSGNRFMLHVNHGIFT